MYSSSSNEMESLQLVQKLAESGASRISLIMRHAARKYDRETRMEPFLGLTESGKKAAFEFGRCLPPGYTLRPFASYIGRCIETAYLMDKGYSMTGGVTCFPEIEEKLAPFYIIDLKTTVGMASNHGVPVFIRKWIDGKISEDIMMSPNKASALMISFLRRQLAAEDSSVLNICITHDWNMYLVRELFLGLSQEEAGEVAFLEGLAIYEKAGELYIAGRGIERQITDILADEV